MGTASNFSGLAISKPEPRKRTKARQARLQATADRSVYQAVTDRDVCCRVCGSSHDLERHHIRGRGHERTTTADVVLLCRTCHAHIHGAGNKLMRLSGNADERLVVHFRSSGVWHEEQR